MTMLSNQMSEFRRALPVATPQTAAKPLPLPPSAHPPERYCRKVVNHLYRNFVGLPGPRLLVFNGPPGEGKTFTVRTVLEDAGCLQWNLSAAKFESVDAGEPARALEEKLREARAKIDRPGGKPVAVVVEDADRLLAPATALTQVTFNTQQLVALLLSECDRTGPRVPIVFTTNRLDHFDPALLRPMRAEVVQFQLAADELKAQVARLFPDLGDRELEELLKVPAERTIAFFVDVQRAVADFALTVWLSKKSPREAVLAAFNGRLPKPVVPSFRLLLDTARELENARHLSHKQENVSW